MDCKRTRRRRVIRGAVFATLLPLVLLGGYVCSVVSLCFAGSAGILPYAVYDNAIWEGFTRPVVWYTEESEWPGAEACEAVLGIACEAGEYIQYGS